MKESDLQKALDDLVSQYTIIVVDDDPNIGEIIETLLIPKNVIVKTVYTGMDAINMVNSCEDNKLVLLDYYLPDMQCVDVAASFDDDVPFIIMTSYGSEETAARMLKAGAKEYLVKAGSFNVLLPQIIDKVIIQLEREKMFKRQEQEINSLYGALEKSSNMISIADSEGNILYTNARFSEMTGYDSRDMEKNLKDIFCSQSIVRNKEIFDVLDAGKEWKGLIYNKKKDQQVYCEDASIFPIKDKDNNITHYVKIASVVRGKKTEDVHPVKAPFDPELFVKMCCHALVQPLQLIFSCSEFLLKKRLEDSDHMEKVEIIKAQADKMKEEIVKIVTLLGE